MKVRNLRPGENWPETLFMGFEQPYIEVNWCWLVENDFGTPVAGLLAASMHGMLFLMRLAATPHAPKNAVRMLLREAFRRAKARGLVGYMTLIDPISPEGKRLQAIIHRMHGVEWPGHVVLSYGFMEKMRRAA